MSSGDSFWHLPGEGPNEELPEHKQHIYKPVDVGQWDYSCGQVADFGISRVKDPTKSYLSATNNNGTPMYMAPEQFNGTHLDEKVAFPATLMEGVTKAGLFHPENGNVGTPIHMAPEQWHPP